MKTDIEIAHSTQLKRIDEVAQQLGINPDAIEHYGKYIAKLPLSLIDEKKKVNSSWLLPSPLLVRVLAKPQ